MTGYHTKLTLAFLLTLFFPLSSLAWNAIGHMIVANIAYQNLDKRVRTTVDKLIVTFQGEYPNVNSLLLLAAWPDTIRTQRIETYSRWHYIDVPFSDDGTPLKNTIDTDNAVWAIYSIQTPIKNKAANPYERARFLAFLAHIVGDLHQPLHTVSRISAGHPDGDKGGNLFPISYNGIHNLHTLWDEGVGLFTGENSVKHVNELTDMIVSLYPKTYFGNQIKDLDPNHWVKEGMENAMAYSYTTHERQIPAAAYVSTGQKIAEQQVALAGYRLAVLLNQLL